MPPYQELLSAGARSLGVSVLYRVLLSVPGNTLQAGHCRFRCCSPMAFAALGGLIELKVRGIPLDVYGQIGAIHPL